MANAEKVAAVAELTERFRDSSGAVLTEYRGLTVAQLAELRRSLGDNATFAVVKNTLTKIAVTEAGLSDQLSSLLAGPSAVAFVDGDVVEAAKGLRDFARANPLLVIKGGVLDGKAITPAEIDQAGRPGAARGAAGQAGRRHEGVAGRRGRDVQRAAGRRWPSSPRRCAPSVEAPRAARRTRRDAPAAGPTEPPPRPTNRRRPTTRLAEAP